MDVGAILRRLLSIDDGCPVCVAELKALNEAQERLTTHAIEAHADRVLYAVTMLPDDVAGAINALGHALEEAP